MDFSAGRCGFLTVSRRIVAGPEWNRWRFQSRPGGTKGAVDPSIVTRVRLNLAAFSLIAAMVAMAGGPLLAQALHPACAATHHDCGKTAARIARCCCDDHDAPRAEASPVQSRVEVRADLSTTIAPMNLVHVASPLKAPIAVQTSPPRLCLLDLPTLFVSFLI